MRSTLPNQFRRALAAKDFARVQAEALSSYLFSDEISHSYAIRARDRLTRKA